MTPRFRCHGFTMAELMVALAVGLLVSMFAAAMLLSSNFSYALQADAADVDDAGRYAIQALAGAVRQAAYVDWSTAVGADDAAPPAITGLDARTLSQTSAALGSPSPNAINGSDVLALRFKPSADGMILNCAGFPVTEEARGWSIFYVARAADGEGELRCKYRGANAWSAGAIVRGVDGFQVLYGVDTDEPRDGVPNRYLSASQVDALDALLPLSGATPEERARDLNRNTAWKRVVVIRVALLMHGAGRLRREGRLRSYDLFGADYAGDGDAGVHIDEALLPERLQLRERRQFNAAVALRNPAW